MSRLSNKLTLTLLAVLLSVGIAYLSISRLIMDRHQHQVHQQLHSNLASNLVAENVLISADGVNDEALEHVFHTLMVVNPNIEVYLLDLSGNILAYSAPYRRVKRESVAMEPVMQFLKGDAGFPLWGDNPRSNDGRKVFSAAPAQTQGITYGYLYVVLGSDQFDDVAAKVSESTLWYISVASLAFLIGFGGLTGTIVFRTLTRRLRRLDTKVSQFDASVKDRQIPEVLSVPDRAPDAGDEIDRLEARVSQMTHTIAEQMTTIQRTDEMRRQLVANVSHDLRTPLAALDGYLQTLRLKRETLSAEQTQEYVDIASKSCDRLTRLVDELFELSCLEATSRKPQPELFCLAELASDVLQNFQLRAQQKDVSLTMDCDPLASHAFAEIGLIERVLENLIVNALAHTPAGGSIRVSMAPGDHSDVRVTVHDSGTGIAQRDLPYLFDRFYRPDDAANTHKSGAGLGLAIVKRILDLHQSRIEAKSRAGQGSSFIFSLPLAEPTPAAG